jgi:hypothetical protein
MSLLSRDGRTIAVDPARLASGEWCHRADKTIGQGDIYASYSADRIGMSQPVRKPFAWNGGLWVCIGISHRRGQEAAEAYRLTHPAGFLGAPVTYREKTADSQAARSDPAGFYHGMTVTHAGKPFILTGPPTVFAPGQAEQMTLF